MNFLRGIFVFLCLALLLLTVAGCINIDVYKVEHIPSKIPEEGEVTAKIYANVPDISEEGPWKHPFTSEVWAIIRKPEGWSVKDDLMTVKGEGYYGSLDCTLRENIMVQDYITRLIRRVPTLEVAGYDFWAGSGWPRVPIVDTDTLEAYATLETSGSGDFDNLLYAMGLGAPSNEAYRGSVLSVINSSEDTVVGTQVTGLLPRWIDIDPVHNKLYITNHVNLSQLGAGDAYEMTYYGEGKDLTNFPSNSITVIRSVWPYDYIATIPITLEVVPTGLVVNSADQKVYVACQHMVNDDEGFVMVVNSENYNIEAQVPIPGSVVGGIQIGINNGFQVIDFNPNNKKVYAISFGGGALTIINGQSPYDIITTEALPHATAVMVNPYNDKVYVAHSGPWVTIISGESNAVITSVDVGGAISLAVDPVTGFVFTVNRGNNSISIIDPETDSEVDRISVGARPMMAAVDSQNKLLYVTNHDDNTVTVIDLDEGSEIATLDVGRYPVGVVVCNGKAYVQNLGVEGVFHDIGKVDELDTTVTVIQGTTVITSIETGIGPLFACTSGNRVYVLNAGMNGGLGEMWLMEPEDKIYIPRAGRMEGAPVAYPGVFKPESVGGNLTFAYTLTSDTPVTIYVFDITGRVIWRKVIPPGPGGQGGSAGYNKVEWNGITDFGSVVGNGVFIYKVISRKKVLGSGKIVVYD